MYRLCKRLRISESGILRPYPYCAGIVNLVFPLSEWHMLYMVVLEIPYSVARQEEELPASWIAAALYQYALWGNAGSALGRC